MLISLLERNRDSFFLSVSFLSERDCCTLSTTCKLLVYLAHDEQIWRSYALERIPFIADNHSHLSDVEKLETFLKPWMTAYCIPTFRRLHEAFHSVTFSPLNGIFRRIPQNLESCRGGLYLLLPAPRGMTLHNVQSVGRGQLHSSAMGEATLEYSEEHKCIVSQVSGFISQISAQIIFERDEFRRQAFTESIFSRMATTVWKTMPRLKSEESATQEFIGNRFDSCLGFFFAMYGSHGNEILHLSIHSSQDETSVESTEQFNFGTIQLQGLKITGDPNVPAGNLSFCLDIGTSCDINAEIERDSRAMVLFDGAGNVDIVDIRSRRMNIQTWAKGYGQINRNPRQWNPEWVPCNILIYREEFDRVFFTILWNDEDEQFRHAMDFKRFILPTV